MKEKKKIGIGTVFEIIFLALFMLFVMPIEIIKMQSLKGKVIILGIIGALIALGIRFPVPGLIALGIVLLLDIIFAIYAVLFINADKKTESSGEKTESSGEQTNYSNARREEHHFFDGLDREAARKEFRRLMKLYHPDNGGDAEMSKAVSEEYNSYCVRHGNGR